MMSLSSEMVHYELSIADIMVLGVFAYLVVYFVVKKGLGICPDLWNIKADWAMCEDDISWNAKIKRHWFYNLTHFTKTYIEVEIKDYLQPTSYIDFTLSNAGFGTIRAKSTFLDKYATKPWKGILTFGKEDPAIIWSDDLKNKDGIIPFIVCMTYREEPEYVIANELLNKK